jgi:hypothetical protein
VAILPLVMAAPRWLPEQEEGMEAARGRPLWTAPKPSRDNEFQQRARATDATERPAHSGRAARETLE